MEDFVIDKSAIKKIKNTNTFWEKEPLNYFMKKKVACFQAHRFLEKLDTLKDKNDFDIMIKGENSMESKKKLANFWKNKRVFVTGHTGFNGSWLLILLNFLGSKVYGYALKPLNKSLFEQANCKKILNKNTYSDINNYKKLKYEINKSKPQIIFHLAAQPLVSQSF